MATPVLALTNAISPLSTVTGVTWPVSNGFIVMPADTSSSPGWGFPIYPGDDSTKARIFPGTLGGEFQYTNFTKGKDRDTLEVAWREKKTKDIQDGGAINWWGPRDESKIGSTRQIISHHGPRSRHFPDVFQLGDSPRHKEVYAGGGIVAIAPGYVTGACLRATLEADPDHEMYPYRLFVVCLVDGEETMYHRLHGLPVPRHRLTPAVEKSLSAMWSKELPGGWKKVGVVGDKAYDPPRTPWFFNESGTEGQCIRMKDHTFAPAPGIADITQKRLHRFKAIFTLETVTGSNLGNEPPFKMTETGKRITKAQWAPIETTPDGLTHTWDEMSLECTRLTRGRQIVAVDYVKDAECPIYLEMNVNYGWIKDYMKGTDPGSRVAPSYRNTNQYYNHMYGGDPQVEVFDFAVQEYKSGDHRAMAWIRRGIVNKLTWVDNGVANGTILEWVHTTNISEVDPTLDHAYSDRMYVRHLDVRAGVVMGMMERDDYAASAFSDKMYYRSMELISTDTPPEESVFTPYADSGPDDFTSFVSNLPPPLRHANATDYVYVQNMPSDDEWKWTYDTYTGARPTDNDDNSKGEFNELWATEAIERLDTEGYKGYGCLEHPHHTAEFGVGITPDGALIANGNLPDLTKDGAGKRKLYTVQSTGLGDVLSLTGSGGRLYPIWVI